MAWLEINLERMEQNATTIKQRLTPEVQFCAVVKANAYGMGIIPAADAVRTQADWYAVNSIAEATLLRDTGLTQPILVLGYIDPHNNELNEAVRHDVTVTIDDLDWAREADRVARKWGKKLKYHLKVDTGMHRFGVEPREITDFIENLKYLPGLQYEGVYSHLADAADPGYSREQQSSFMEALFKLQGADLPEGIAHLCATDGIATLPDAHFGMVRSGMGIYGFSQTIENLKPVWELKARIIKLKRVSQNAPIGYGRTFTTTRSSIIAVVDVGYVDGLPRVTSNQLKGYVESKPLVQVGRLCMNYTMFDATGIPSLKVGDTMTIISDQHKETQHRDIAQKAESSIYELSARLPESLERRYLTMGRGSN